PLPLHDALPICEHFVAETVFDDHLDHEEEQEDPGEPCREFIEALGAVDLAVGASEAALLFTFGTRWCLTEVGFGDVFGVWQGGRVRRWGLVIGHNVSLFFLPGAAVPVIGTVCLLC